MTPINDWDNVKATGERKSLPAGGYIAIIKSAEDFPDKEYLKVEYDIAAGEYKDYFASLEERAGFWGGHMIRSYKEKAKGMFKGFIVAVEDSNKKFKWNWDESRLIGQKVGLILGEEEYNKNNGEIGTRLTVKSVKPVSEIEAGNFTIPEKKLLPKETAPVEGFSPIKDEDLPF